jgi:hypothetical protein
MTHTIKQTFNEELNALLLLIYEQPLALQSNEARTRAKAVAAAASLGFITSLTLEGLEPTNEWRLTMQGYWILMSRHRVPSIPPPVPPAMPAVGAHLCKEGWELTREYAS